MEQRHTHGIREWFVLVMDKLGQAGENIFVVENDLVMVGPKVLGNGARV
jgi:hypothetical protein